MPKETSEEGVPPWVMTFADLMTLLMCFFVLLLAFSEMDIAKFKELAGSMQDAFGVQTEVEVRTMPKGTGLIAKLDIYWKTPPRMPPAWITPKAILEGS
jgi:chemotaxis protein MotB